MTVTIVPDINKPVMPFGGPGSASAKTRSQSPRTNTSPKKKTLAQRCREAEPLFRPKECSADYKPEPEKQKSTQALGMECSALKQVLSSAKNDFSDLKTKLKYGKPNGEKRTYSGKTPFSGFKSCRIVEYRPENPTQYRKDFTTFTCSAPEVANVSVQRRQHDGIAKSIQACMGIQPFKNTKNNTWMTKFQDTTIPVGIYLYSRKQKTWIEFRNPPVPLKYAK